MRKFLSLVLALVMVMSLTTLTAGAKEFTDADAINYDEAVDVISALGVVDGYAGGEFGPSGVLTRQAAAKIICNLILGPTTAHALVADAAPFPDVPTSSEFAGYIAYCANQNIIGGYPDGTFRPGGSLTGYAFMKMLLGALGYDPSIEQFGGPNWSINVGKRALGIGLSKGLLEGFDGTKAVTREEAALYALNTLKATMVDYDNKITVTGQDGGVINIGNNTAKDVETSNDTNKIKKDGKVQFAERYFEDLRLNDEGADDFQRPSNVWTLKSTEIGTYPKTADMIASYTGKVSKGDIYSILNSSVRNDLEDGSKDEATLDVYADGVSLYSSDDVPSNNPYYERNSSKEIYNLHDNGTSRKGTLTEVYLDSDDNSVIITMINTYVYQAANDYSSSRDDLRIASAGDTAITLNNYTLKGEDFANLDGFKTDDYILVTAYKDGTTYKVKTVAPAEVVSGTVTAYSKNDSVTIDGTKYSYSAICRNDSDKGTDYSVGQEAKVVLDAYGNVIAVDEALSSSSYVFVSKFGSTSSLTTKAIADAYFTDGTNEEITVKKVVVMDTTGSPTRTELTSATAIDDIDNNHAKGANRWYTYSVDSDGKYTLTDPATVAASKYVSGTQKSDADATDGPELLKNGTVQFMKNVNSGSKADKANDKTIVVLKDTDGDVNTYTGSANIPDVTLKNSATASVYYLKDKDGYVAYAFTDIEGVGKTNVDLVDGGEEANFIYVMKYDGEHYVGDGKSNYTYKAFIDGEDAESKPVFDNNDLGTGDVYALYYKYNTNSDDVITRVTATPGSNGRSGQYFSYTTQTGTVSASNNSLTLGSTDFLVNSDSHIVLVSRADDINDKKGESYEITNNITARDLASRLDGYRATMDFAGEFTSSTSETIKTLYVTVTSVEEDFTGVTIPVTPVTVTVGDTTTVTISVGSGFTVADADVISDTTAKATVAKTDATTLTITGVAAGSANIKVTAHRNSDGATKVYTIPVTVNPAFPDTVSLNKTAVSVVNGAGADASIKLTIPATGFTVSSVTKKSGTDVADITIGADNAGKRDVSVNPKAVGEGVYEFTVSVDGATPALKKTFEVTVTVTARTSAAITGLSDQTAAANDTVTISNVEISNGGVMPSTATVAVKTVGGGDDKSADFTAAIAKGSGPNAGKYTVTVGVPATVTSAQVYTVTIAATAEDRTTPATGNTFDITIS